MSIQYKKVLADKTNCGALRNTNKIQYIVVHYTANDGDTDEANARYFQTPNRKASAHYFVDDDSVTQSVLDNRVAWHCGGSLYNNVSKTHGGTLYKKCTNSNSIGIEMCDTQRDGVYNLSNQTRINTIELIVDLMIKYKISIENIVRHFDVTGKNCPSYFVNEDAWSAFKSDIAFEFNKRIKEEDACADTGVNITTTTHTTTTSTQTTTTESLPFKVKIKADGLNIRAGAGTKYSKLGTIVDKGVYTIVDVNTDHTWGLLKSGRGWICISSKYVDRV